MWLLEQSVASTLVLVCMEINLIPHRQSAKGLFLPTASSIMYKDTGMIRNPGERGRGRKRTQNMCLKLPGIRSPNPILQREMSAVFSPLAVTEGLLVLPSNWQ